MTCTVAGVISAGGDEDSQIFASLGSVQKLAGLDGQITLLELRVPGAAGDIENFAARIASGAPGIQARPIRQIADTEGALLARIQLLIFSMAALILALTALCVLATMAALAMERRADVGLMKALGGSIGRIVGLFLAEVGILGATGGVIGYIGGIALTLWAGRRVFGTVISPRLEVFPLTVVLMVLVALAGALPLRLLGRVKPAVILRGD
jgi:putative ABC transport system permease protein